MFCSVLDPLSLSMSGHDGDDDDGAVSPQGKAEQELKELKEKETEKAKVRATVDKLEQQLNELRAQVITYQKALQERVAITGGDSLLAALDQCDGTDAVAAAYVAKIAELKKEQMVCVTCFAHLHSFHLSSMTQR